MEFGPKLSSKTLVTIMKGLEEMTEPELLRRRTGSEEGLERLDIQLSDGQRSQFLWSNLYLALGQAAGVDSH